MRYRATVRPIHKFVLSLGQLLWRYCADRSLHSDDTLDRIWRGDGLAVQGQVEAGWIACQRDSGGAGQDINRGGTLHAARIRHGKMNSIEDIGGCFARVWNRK